MIYDILEKLQTKSLKDLFLETSDKEKRMKEAKDALEELYKDLHFYKRMVKYNERAVKYDIRKKENTVPWEKALLETQETTDEFENDYSNYIQGGERFIFEYLSE